jgi:hypothetical protein
VPNEQVCLKELAGVARRDGGVLTLKLADGKTKTISDARECEDTDREASCVRYRLVGRIGSRLVIVLVEPYECPYVLLVNRRTGEETLLDGHICLRTRSAWWSQTPETQEIAPPLCRCCFFAGQRSAGT